MRHTSTNGARVTAAVVCVLIAATGAQAQFHDLVTTDDGQQLYFSSSLRLRGTDQFLHQKIFRIVDDKPELVVQVEFQWFWLGGNVGRSNYYSLRSPSLSGDGRIVSFVAHQGCAGGSACAGRNFDDFEVLNEAGRPTGIGRGCGQLSRNGHYALLSGTGCGRGLFDLIDLTTPEHTGIRLDLPGSTAQRQAVTSEGQVVTFGARIYSEDASRGRMSNV